MHIWRYVLTAVVAYFIGNLNFSIIFSKIVFNKDIRNYGSGNAGTTNTFRTFGPLLGTIVMLCDIGKGALAVYLGKTVMFGYTERLAAVLAALFVAIGHVYPVIFRFRGGKGVAAMLITDKTGPLCALHVVNGDEDVMLIRDDGTIIRMPVTEIREIGRHTQGVRLMQVDSGLRVVSACMTDHEDPEEEGAETAEQAPSSDNS